MAKKPVEKGRVIAENRKARFNYEIGETFEAGISLAGSEVKSLRLGKAMIAESYADAKNGEIFLINADIPEYNQANRANHDRRRIRKLLLKHKEIAKLSDATEREGMTLVPLRLYFNARGLVKLLLALGKGKKSHDKRDTIKKREWQRDKARLMRAR